MMKLAVVALLVFLSVSPFSCTNDSEDCKPTHRQTLSNTIALEPDQAIYHVGDVVFLSIVIPSSVYFSQPDETVDLHVNSGIETVLASEYYLFGFQNTEKEILEGENYSFTTDPPQSLTYDSPVLHYFPVENQYRYKLKVTFTQAGNFFITTKATFAFDYSGVACGDYFIDAVSAGDNSGHTKNFTVVP